MANEKTGKSSGTAASKIMRATSKSDFTLADAKKAAASALTQRPHKK